MFKIFFCSFKSRLNEKTKKIINALNDYDSIT